MDLANCPWCGADPLMDDYRVPGREWEYFVLCRHCGLRGPARGSEQDAARAWAQIVAWKEAWKVE